MIAARAPKAAAVFAMLLSLGPRAAQPEHQVQVTEAAQQGSSPPLFLIRPVAPVRHVDHEPRRFRPRQQSRLAPVVDPVLQAPTLGPLSPPAASTYEATGEGFTGPGGTFTVNSDPPDSDGDVGPNHYISIVNSSFSILGKTDGRAIFGPVPTNTLFQSLGGLCKSDNDGDGVVLYDPIADRWFLTQFAVTAPDPNYYQCVAVSKTKDPTGEWWLYAFKYSTFNDYGKFGVWPDGYYATYNMFSGSGSFVGGQVCVFERAKMLLGQIATQQCAPSLGSNIGGILPADMDGHTPPPPGSPNYILGFGNDVLQFWTFHVDWVTPGNSALSVEKDIPVAAFAQACPTDGTCIVQPTPPGNTAQFIDSLADRMMFRLAYRNFGDHESLVTNHTVVAGGSTGVRWYELRDLRSSSGPAVFQQGTFAPDSSYRWMGSIAMDQSGNLAMGYSLSSSTRFPGIWYAGRLAGDPANTMGQGEREMFPGSGSQIGIVNHAPVTRWGDYTNISVDPVDDCTFWYVNEYLTTTGIFNWHERVGFFKFPGCGVVAKGFSLSLNPVSRTVTAGASVTYTVSTAATGGSTAPIALSLGPLPTGITGVFDTPSIAPGGAATLTLTADVAATPFAPTTFTVSGTSTDGTHGAIGTISVVGPNNNDFGISISPASRSTPPATRTPMR